MMNQTAIMTGPIPHDLSCRCDECLAEVHSYHDSIHDDPKCPICHPSQRVAPEAPTLATELCYECLPIVGIPRTMTGRTRTINIRQDATCSYEMSCGHWGI